MAKMRATYKVALAGTLGKNWYELLDTSAHPPRVVRKSQDREQLQADADQLNASDVPLLSEKFCFGKRR